MRAILTFVVVAFVCLEKMAAEVGEDSALPKAESNEQQDDNDQRQASPAIPKDSSSEKNKDLARKKSKLYIFIDK